MAFAPRALSRINQVAVGLASGLPKSAIASMFFYATDDAAAVVEAAGYWNNARNTVRVGDTVIASMVNGGTPVMKQYVFTVVPATGNVVAVLQSTTAG